MVRSVNGHVQICPAFKKKDSAAESVYYYSSADKRSKRSWVTVKRDREGLKHDVEMFHCLMDQQRSEREMHRFLEEHPAFLMEAFLGVPVSHRPRFVQPNGDTPDYSILPIIGKIDSSAIGLLELKGPGEEILKGKHHRGFAAKVRDAVDQVRDYEKYLQDPANAVAILREFGYVPNASNLAVLIGREPRTAADQEIFLRRTEELHVRVVTYDEILKVQADQLPGASDPYW
jgi:hypothetical protein